jgi:hypothetical protein
MGGQKESREGISGLTGPGRGNISLFFRSAYRDDSLKRALRTLWLADPV